MPKQKQNHSLEAVLGKKMHVIAVDMGYGHQRAAYPFLGSASHGIINANHYQGISRWEQKSWASGRWWYELVSRFKNLPLLGEIAFAIMDYVQRIEPFYPRRDLSKQSQQLKYFYRQIKKGLGKRLIEQLNNDLPVGAKEPLPLLTTFFVSAYFAEYHGYRGKIYCVVCDADVARAWAPAKAATSKINYLVPNRRVKDRLQLYGVRPQKIFVTGFPLPKENIGDQQQKIVRADLKARLANLDPRGIYRHKYAKLIEDYLGPVKDIKKPQRPLTITFAVGGAGAQRDIGIMLLKKLHRQLKTGQIGLNLIAGNRNDVYLYYQKTVKQYQLDKSEYVKIIYAEDKLDYFKIFNKILRQTDILWTKPSELTFYSGLGLPIIMAEPVGSQEQYNRGWLLAIGAGVDSQNPAYVDEWLFDWLDSGWLAEAAMEGFLDAPRLGTYNIENIVLHNKTSEIEDVHLL
jgi:hypothetical protein